MKVILGYVSIPLTIGITSSSTITYSNYNKLENKNQKLQTLIRKNLNSLEEILKYNKKNNIHFYRMTSNLIPLATLIDYDYINPYLSLYKKIGDYANENKIRIDAHLSQYCILNSTNTKVIDNSINEIKYHVKLFDALNFLNPILILHIGSSQFGKEKSIKRFINNFNKLDEKIKKLIVLENDDKVYNIKDTLGVCKELNIPFVLDYHHHLCNSGGIEIENYLKEIFLTWNNKSCPPKVHFSSPKSKLKKDFRSHNDYIDSDSFIEFLEIIKDYTNEIYIMLEAKKKDEALFKLVRELKYKTNYKFIDETTFLV